MRFLFVFLFLLGAIESVYAQAEPVTPARYYVAKMSDAAPIDYEKPTHFFVIGYGRELFALFQEAATGRLLRLKEVFPDHQFIFIAYNETQLSPHFNNLNVLKRWGYEIIKTEYDRSLSDYRLIHEMAEFKKIHSLNIFSHANQSSALFNTYSYYQREDINFVPSASISLFGCNAGFLLAKHLSTVFGIPVAGALTASDFQKLHSLGDFYRNDEHLKPAEGHWSRTNELSFNQPIACSKGACLRMKPDEFPYSGMHGKYPHGLPYYKFFCPQLSEESCLQAKAQWILGFLSLKPLNTNSSLEDYKEVVRDVLCPNNAKTNLKADCTQKLIDSESDSLLIYSPFKGDMPYCDWQGCDFNIHSKTNFIEEYQSFLKAYPYLQSAQ